MDSEDEEANISELAQKKNLVAPDSPGSEIAETFHTGAIRPTQGQSLIPSQPAQPIL